MARVSDFLRQHPGFSLTVAGALIYGLFWFRSAVFLRVFATDPEAVGLGYQQILVRGVLFVLIVNAIPAVLAIFPNSNTGRLVRRGPVPVALLFLAFYTLVTVGAYLDARQLASGESRTQNPFAWPRVEQASLTWLGPPDLPIASDELLYLGTGEAGHVLYDPSTSVTSVIPASRVLLHLVASS